jgi:hypothetical protein
MVLYLKYWWVGKFNGVLIKNHDALTSAKDAYYGGGI